MKRGSGVPVARITQAILVLRGQRVLLDAELARLYGVTTKAPNQAVKRNAARFPADFVFRFTPNEARLADALFGGRSLAKSAIACEVTGSTARGV